MKIKIAVEPAPNLGCSNASVRVRPLPGQVFSPSMYVECSRKMRSNLTYDNVAVLYVKETSREGGTPFLYSYFGDPVEFLPRQEALRRIKDKTL